MDLSEDIEAPEWPVLPIGQNSLIGSNKKDFFD